MTNKWSNIDCPFALSSMDFRRAPYERLAEMRAESAAAVIEANGFRMWLIPRYDDVRRILKDQSYLKDVVEHRKQLAIQCVLRPELRARMPHAARRSLLDRDGAEHRRLRSVIGGEFSQSMVERHRPKFRQIAENLLGNLPEDISVDLVSSFARPLCMTFIAGVFGVPSSEANAFALWENAMLTGTTKDEVEGGVKECFDFALRMVDLKRREPGDDLFTKLLNARSQGHLDNDELTSTFIVLMVGGGEPVNAISSGLWLLLSHPEYIAAAREDAAMIPRIVEEVLRLESPFRILPPRFSHSPTVLGDITIPAGELIAVCPASANRDPGRFPHPNTFAPSDRSKDHLAFGDGAHKCLGSLLAKMEIEEAIRAFVDPSREYVLDVSRGRPRWRPGDFMRRLDRLFITARKSRRRSSAT